jgi:hypothetical protein
MKPPKLLIRTGAVLLIVVAAVLVVRAAFNFMEGRRLAGALAELKEKGVPVTAGDLSAPCPDEENAARLWKAIENIFTIEDKTDGELIAKAWEDVSTGKPIAQADRSALQDLISRNQRTFELLTEMKDMPCFLYRDPASSLIEAKMPNALRMIRLTKLLLFSSLLKAEAGDIPAAVDQIRTGLKFAPMIAQDGRLIATLVGFADARTLAFFLGDVLRGRNLDDEALLRLIAELDPGAWPGRLAGAIRGERVVFVEAGEYAMRGSSKELDFLFGEPFILKNIGVWIIRPVMKLDIRKALPVYDELEAQAQRPYYESRAFFGSRGRKLMERPWYGFLSKAMIADFEVAFMKEALVEATLLADRTGLACRLYKSRTGRYPDSLEALVPGILKEVPIDPFTGKALVYRREGEGFVVYSLGTNEKDDGGRSTFNVSRLVMFKDDDLAWREDR